MDLSHEARGEAARAIRQVTATPKDAALIANVLRARPEDGIDQWLALGGVCPYWPNQVRERAAWIAEIRRQTGEPEVSE